MNRQELKDFLDYKADFYENSDFISSDPIQVPHKFSKKEDIEIIAFLVSTIAWGKRKMIINNGKKMVELLDHQPYDFILNHQEKDLKKLAAFVHRTFNHLDFCYFLKALQHIYKHHQGLETIFTKYSTSYSTQIAITKFREIFFEIPHLARTEKHVSNPLKNSAYKRINMFLRWMVRTSENGVDFGLWNNISTSALSCPLDVHSGNVARKLGLLSRKQNDGKALKELDENLRKFDAEDPVKYDFALFGLGVFEKF
ncbi:TIGR02757 family protein [Mesonia sp. K7]|uniref:TIGR02757 family protein n=1 Tax=Mesonia sp. K7 TaxID=2218606 RepID=UPI000DA91010|nr:TIGR02757 family protein [Mesonia sp. K7]PZD78205.1 TIGR02757 family protein [Mesonia sp. K7]